MDKVCGLKSRNPRRTIRFDPLRPATDAETTFIIDESIYHAALTVSNAALDRDPGRVIEELESRLDRFIAQEKRGSEMADNIEAAKVLEMLALKLRQGRVKIKVFDLHIDNETEPQHETVDLFVTHKLVGRLGSLNASWTEMI